VNKINRLTTINGEKTNGRTKKVGTVKPPEKLLMDILHRSSFDTTFDSEFSLTQDEIELATRPGNIAISLSKKQH
jgi:hypothetical protein